MSYIPRLFLNENLLIDKEIKILDKQHHYLINVVKRKINDEIILINGIDGEFLSKIIFLNNKYLILKIISKTKIFFKPNFLGLIFSPIQKIDLLLKASTELNITDFFPINTDFSNIPIKNNKLEGNIIEAVEQCERLDLPIIHKIDTFKKTIDLIASNKDNLIFFCQERINDNNIINILNKIDLKNKNIYTIIGPEGGFSIYEKEYIKQYSNIIPVGLGDNILRTETACIAILSILTNTIKVKNI